MEAFPRPFHKPSTILVQKLPDAEASPAGGRDPVLQVLHYRPATQAMR
jgi:hypothetical protein